MITLNLRMPDSVVLDESTYSVSFGKFSCQPLERGFGVTLGNSLRRVLLSSINGSAIIGVKFGGILHEFTTIPGVVEDVAEIILNLKLVRLKLLGDKKSAKLEFTVTGPCEFTAADIQRSSPDIEILNPDLHIATINDKIDLHVELRIARGRGYVPANENKFADATIGLIPIDAIYTPIKNVKYEVENVRIGDKNDFEKLTIEISTDGSISPDDALRQASKILREHIELFIGTDTEPEIKVTEVKRDAEKERIRKLLLTKVEDMELSVRAHNCLKSANIRILADLVSKDEQEMLKFRNFGRKSLSELSAVVESYGLDFGMDITKYLTDES